MEKMKIFNWKINKNLVPMKAHYFLWNAGTGPVVPFLSTYARQLGFSSVIVGLIYLILPLAGMIAKPITGLIADRFKCQKVIFLGAQILTGIAFLAIYFAPQAPVERPIHFACDYGVTAFDIKVEDECLLNTLQRMDSTVSCQMDCLLDDKSWNVVCENWNATEYCETHPRNLKFTAFINLSKSEALRQQIFFIMDKVKIQSGRDVVPDCPKGNNISTTCDVNCQNSFINDAVAKPTITDEAAYVLSQFWIFLVLMIAGWVGQAIVVSVGDTICFELLGDKPNRYGYQRLFGALGWGIFSLTAGFIVDAVSKGESQKNFAPAFFLAVAFIIVDVLVSSRLQFSQSKMANNIFKDVTRLLDNIQIIIFIIWCICVGLCTSLVWQFLFWLMEDLAKAQGCESEVWMKTLEGIAMSIQCLGGELPFFFLSSWILKRIGHVHAMSLVLLVLGIRFVLYSVITDPWWFLPIEFSNGLTFGLFYACMASYASIVAPPGTETTVQGLVGAVFEGIGVSLGSLLAGKLYDLYGGPLTFRIFGIGALVACLLHAAVQQLVAPKGKNKK